MNPKTKRLLVVALIAFIILGGLYLFLNHAQSPEQTIIPIVTSSPEVDAQAASPGADPAQDSAAEETPKAAQSTETPDIPDEDGSYTSKDDVALYIHTYGHLPSNFMTKKQAKELGWSGGSLEPYAPGMCIGGNQFGNYEGLLPEAPGRVYTECDIDTMGAKKRGAKRIVFSNDGLIYYTDDHYESFELLYGEVTP